MANPFLQSNGRIEALVFAQDAEEHGALSIRLSKNGAFSASLIQSGITYKFSGVFELDGTFETVLKKKGQPELNVQLNLDAITGTLDGTISGSGGDFAINGAREERTTKTNPSDLAGSYTVAFLPESDGTPAGISHATIKVNSSGAVKLVGKLGDGSPVAIGTEVLEDGSFSFMQKLYRGKGTITGRLGLTRGNGESNVFGSVRWERLAPESMAFVVRCNALGSVFTPPTADSPLFPDLEEVAGNIAVHTGERATTLSVQELLSMDSFGKCTDFSTADITTQFSLNAKTGLFSITSKFADTGSVGRGSGVMLRNHSIGAGYIDKGGVKHRLELKRTASASYVLAVSATNGTVGRSPAQAKYDSGSIVQLTAVPAEGYVFDHWSGDARGNQNPLSVTMTAHRLITAVFTPAPVGAYVLSATVLPIAAGTVSGTGAFDNGSAVVLTANPTQGHSFVNWTEDGTPVSSTPSYSFSVTGNRSLVANFAPVTVPTAGLLAHLSFDSSNATDQSGNGNNGTASGNVQYVAAKHGLGLKLSADGGYVDMVPDTFQPTVTTSCFVRLDSLPTAGNMMSLMDAWKDSENYLLYVHNAGGVTTFTAGFHKRASTTSVYPEIHARSTTQPVVATFYHVTGTFNGQDLKIYVNGQLETTLAVTGSPYAVSAQGNTDLRLGIGVGQLNGVLDEVRLYDRALSDSEIQQLAQ